jgi:hypothetical protein
MHVDGRLMSVIIINWNGPKPPRLLACGWTWPVDWVSSGPTGNSFGGNAGSRTWNFFPPASGEAPSSTRAEDSVPRARERHRML